MEVRVLEDCGKVWTDSGPIALTKGSIVFVRRYQNLQTSDLVFRFEIFCFPLFRVQVEQYIREGKIEHILTDSTC